MIITIDGGVTSPKGFKAAAAEAQIKYKDRLDMALIYSDSPCEAAGTFTTNVVKASCVLWDKEMIENYGKAKAIVINAGIANACTGQQGKDYCKQTAKKASVCLGIEENEVLIASTGVIGMQLPMEKIEKGIEQLSKTLSDEREAAKEASRAIMTTDTHPKEAAVTFTVGGKTAVLGGMCKGSGMIHPNMCTMLSFLTTDVSISTELLQEALREDVQRTYNMVSVDGDTSTNDTVLLLANHKAGNPMIVDKSEDYYTFVEALRTVNTTLAKMIAADGEGATSLIETTVINAKSEEDARILAKSVICSSLTKAAVYGKDANWGRILCALGYSGASFDPEKTELYFASENGKILLFKEGAAADYSEEEATKILSAKEVSIIVDMKEGTAKATAWGCDLTYDYVKINADYRS